MPDDLYAAFMQRIVPFVHSLGKRTLGWQETVRAITDPAHMIQYWISSMRRPMPREESSRTRLPPEIAANMLQSRRDIDAALRHGMRIVLSPQSNAYLDFPYAETSADATQEERRLRLGLAGYPRKTIAESFDWDPATVLGQDAWPEHFGGVACNMWCETVADFDDLMFLVLPRLAGVAEKAWSDPRVVTWDDHAASLAAHGRLWTADGVNYFASSLVDWEA